MSGAVGAGYLGGGTVILPGMYRELHSKKDDELEQTDQHSFSRVVIAAGVAMGAIFVLALVAMWVAGRFV